MIYNFIAYFIQLSVCRRMFPVVRASVSGLEAGQSYFVLLDIVLAEESRYKYQVGPHSVLNPPVPYDLCVSVPTSHLLTVG